MTSWLPEGSAEWGGQPVAHFVTETRPRRRAVLCGHVRSAVGRSGGSGPRFEVVLEDRTGTIVLCFDGRTTLPGVEPGVCLTVEGTVALVRGRRLLRNPLYRFSGSSGSSTS